MLNRFFYVLLGLSVVGLIPSCDLINPEEDVPSWIQIDSFELLDNPQAEEGSLSHDIVDAWVFIDDEMIGIYELPAKIPILDEGVHKLTVGPGIKVSTVSTLRDNYLFYTAHIDNNFELKRGEVAELTPTVSYRSPEQNYVYELIEDFEQPFLQMEETPDSEVALVKTTDPDLVFEGDASGLLEISESNTAAALKTSLNYELPNLGKVVYLEFDYYTDFDLTVGMFVNNNTFQDEFVDYLTLRPTTDSDQKWKKAYVALTSVISGSPNPIDYYIYFNANIQVASARKDGKVMLDNIKLLYQAP